MSEIAGKTEDVVGFLEAQKIELREEFRKDRKYFEKLQEDRRKIDEKLARVSSQLDRIKDRLSFTDDLIRQTNPSSGKPGPSLPGVGRYAGMGQSQAIRTYFKDHPKKALTVGELIADLETEGYESQTSSEESGVASFHVALSRLEREQFLVSYKEGRNKFFQKNQA